MPAPPPIPSPAGQRESSATTYKPGGPEGHPRVARNVASIVVARALGQVLNLLAIVGAARYLGVEAWGVVAFAIATLEIFTVLANFGIDTASLRAVAIARRAPTQVIRHVVRLKLVMSSVAFFGLALATLAVPQFGEQQSVLLIIGLSIFPQTLTSALTVRFQSEHLMQRMIVVQFASSGTYLVGVYSLIAAGASVEAFVLLIVAVHSVTFLATLGMSATTWGATAFGVLGGSVNRPALRELVRQSLPLGVLQVVVVIYSRLGVFLLESSYGLEAVGQYYAAFKISEVMLVVGGAISVSAYPVFARLAEGGHVEELRRTFIRYSRVAAVLTIAGAALITLTAEPVLGLIGSEYVPAAAALAALAWASAFMVQNQLLSTVINSFGKFHYVTMVSAVNLGIFLIAGTALIPEFGVVGASGAILITEACNGAMQWTLVRQLLRRASGIRRGTT